MSYQYSIKEVSKKFDISYRTVRYWESIMPEIIISKRDSSNNRFFDNNDIMVFQKIISMKSSGMRLDQIKLEMYKIFNISNKKNENNKASGLIDSRKINNIKDRLLSLKARLIKLQEIHK